MSQQQLLNPERIFVFGEPVDMRKGFNGLYCLVKHGLGEEPSSGDLFIFINRRRNYIKALIWDRTGFMIIAKRLETGRFKLRNKASKIVITKNCLRKLLDGISVGGLEISGSKHSNSGHGKATRDDDTRGDDITHTPAANISC